jgi:hypothetical protein
MFVIETKFSVHFYERYNIQFVQEQLRFCPLMFPYSFHKDVSKVCHLSPH